MSTHGLINLITPRGLLVQVPSRPPSVQIFPPATPICHVGFGALVPGVRTLELTGLLYLCRCYAFAVPRSLTGTAIVIGLPPRVDPFMLPTPTGRLWSIS